MNCNCVAMMDNKLAAKGEGYRVATAFVFGPGMAGGDEQLQIETYYPGPARRGRKKPPGIICNFCPFCGTKAAKES